MLYFSYGLHGHYCRCPQEGLRASSRGFNSSLISSLKAQSLKKQKKIRIQLEVCNDARLFLTRQWLFSVLAQRRHSGRASEQVSL